MEELEQVLFGEDSPSDVLVEESFGNLKALGKKVNGTCAVCETDKGNFAITPWERLVVKCKGLRQ